MKMMERKAGEIRYNAMSITSSAGFARIRGGACGGCTDVYFVRLTGADGSYGDDIEKMDRLLSDESARGNCIYARISEFPKLSEQRDIEYYRQRYGEWKDSGFGSVQTRSIREKDGIPARRTAEMCREVCRIYRSFHRNVSEHMERNFVIKLLFWLDATATVFFRDWDIKRKMKFAAQNVTREQEYLFCYLLTGLGIDVLLLQYAEDIAEDLDRLNLSASFSLGEKRSFVLKPYDKERYRPPKENRKTAPEASRAGSPATSAPPSAASAPVSSASAAPPSSAARSAPSFSTAGSVTSSPLRPPASASPSVSFAGSGEKDFEELALLASSVVMISVCDVAGNVIATGSGIMIGENGYILTNNHVIAGGGVYYSVRIENENRTYETDQVVKYNGVLDLAIIQIDRRLKPLPVYGGKKALVRGQKVVAIGSPLGMFNSVSDGIISGFRDFDSVSMIQFTAPVSHGSSGGALLNLYGEVIGIITAGIDQGQNINLAVGHEFIRMFTRGFR